MSKKSTVMLAIILIVSACAPAPAQPPTVTQVSASATPLPTDTPEATPTPESQFPEQFTKDYLAKFENVYEGTKMVAGEEKKVIFGTDLKTKTEQVIGMEMDGQMVIMGEWVDAEGRSFYAYISSGYDIGQRIGVTSKTPEILFGTSNATAAINLFKSFGAQFNLDPVAMKNKIMLANGKIQFKVAVGDLNSEEYWAVKFVNSEYTADITKPVEIILIYKTQDFEALDQKIKDLMLFDDVLNKQDSSLIEASVLLDKPNGQIQIITVSTGVETTTWVLNPTTEEQNTSGYEKYVREFLSNGIGASVLRPISVLGKIAQGPKAFWNTMSSHSSLSNIARDLFEYTITP